MLFKFGKVNSPQCFFCKLHEETIMHLFHDCLIVKRISNKLRSILSNNMKFSIITPQSIIFRFWDLDTNEHLVLNHLLLIFKTYIYNARTTGYLNKSHLLIYIKGIKDANKKKKKCENDAKRRKKPNKKCKNVLIKKKKKKKKLTTIYIREKNVVSRQFTCACSKSKTVFMKNT